MTDDGFVLREEFYFARYRLGTVVLTPVVALFMFMVPPIFANVVLVLVNLYALRVEQRYNYVNPITYTLIALGVGLLAVQVFLPTLYDAYFFATFVFCALFAMAAGLALIGQPFTNFRDPHGGRKDIHWLTTGNWMLVYLICAVICFYIPTNLELYFLPPVFVAMGAAMTLWFQLCYGHGKDAARVGTTNPLAQAFPLDRTSVREIYGFFAEGLMQSRRRSRGRTHRTVEELVDFQLGTLTDEHLAALRYYVARDEKGIKGCISAGHGVNGRLTVEELYPTVFDLKPLKSYGKIIEFDNFAIRNDARRAKDLPLALLTTVIDYAVSVDAKLVIIEALPESEPLYRKLGCEELYGEYLLSPEGFSNKVMFMNLERVMLKDPEGDEYDEYNELLNIGAIERYTKRRAFASLFALRSMFELSAEDIRNMAFVQSHDADAATQDMQPGGKTYA